MCVTNHLITPRSPILNRVILETGWSLLLQQIDIKPATSRVNFRANPSKVQKPYNHRGALGEFPPQLLVGRFC